MLKNQENPDHCAALARRKGVIFGLSAYVVWGFFPVYFKLVKAVPPLEMVSHRVLWSFSFLLVLITWNGAWPALLDLLKRPKYVAALAASTLMISSNWLVFIYSVSIGELLQASLMHSQKVRANFQNLISGKIDFQISRTAGDLP